MPIKKVLLPISASLRRRGSKIFALWKNNYVGDMSVHEYRYIEHRKWDDTAKEISQLESQGWELVSIANAGSTGLKPHQAWLRLKKF